LEVLQDLDYGSDFLLRLNEEWLDAHLAATPLRTRSFSLGGDDHSGLINQIFWQTHEDGSDSTVRVSGANLNFRFVRFDQTAGQTAPAVKQLRYQVPHLVIPGVSHTGDKGILGGQQATEAVVYPFIKQALSVDVDAVNAADQYAAVATDWQQRTTKWSTDNPLQCNATIVFSLHHPGGRAIKDSLILIKDRAAQAGNDTQAILNVAGSMEPRQPIRNDTVPSSVSFYVNYAKFFASYPHTVEIQINSGCNEIIYPPTAYTVTSIEPAGQIRPNEFIYVKVTLDRQSLGTYSVIPQSQNLPTTQTWPPMPKSFP
jgi:hypothetical protein